MSHSSGLRKEGSGKWPVSAKNRYAKYAEEADLSPDKAEKCQFRSRFLAWPREREPARTGLTNERVIRIYGGGQLAGKEVQARQAAVRAETLKLQNEPNLSRRIKGAGQRKANSEPNVKPVRTQSDGVIGRGSVRCYDLRWGLRGARAMAADGLIAIRSGHGAAS
jgi:hypothetical protein